MSRHTIIPAVYLLLKKGNSVLLARRANTNYYDGWYSLPAGHVEIDELPIKALIRECQEEIGITLKESDLAHVHTMYRERTDEPMERVDLFFSAELKPEYEPTNCEPDKCDDLSWYETTDLPDNLIQNVRRVIELVDQGIGYSELDAETLNEDYKMYKETLS